MPGLDGTGPRGLGQTTGRGLGKCNQSTKTSFGRRRGFGRRYFQNVDSKESLQEEKKILEERLEYLNKELDK